MNHDTTINPDELAFYEGLAAFWWDRSGPFWPLHKLNTLRVSWILDLATNHFGRSESQGRPLEGLRVLDIGCGGGILSESMARLGAEVTGIDVVEKNIRIANLHAQSQQLEIDYRLCTAEALTESGETYDLVFNMEVVEHVADLDAFMRSCNRLVAANGQMFIATINRTWLAWLLAIVGAEYVLRWLPKGTHRWSEFRRPGEIEELLKADGLEIRDQSGVAVNPLTRGFRLMKNTDVNYMLLAQHAGTGGW